MIKNNSVITLRNVSKTYKLGKTSVQALRGVDMDIAEGAFIALSGPSGSGKSTLLNIIGCLDTPTEGQVIFNDTLVLQNSRKQKEKIRRSSIGFVFQQFNLVPVWTVNENVEFPLMLNHTPARQRRRLVEETLEAVGLKDRRKHFPSQLSGGELQRVAISRAIVKRPSIVLADEPTANLDSDTARSIVELMQRLNLELRTTFIIATHDASILETVEQVNHIRDGRVEPLAAWQGHSVLGVLKSIHRGGAESAEVTQR
jgi:putative ABC transport system ATP-binding protein